MKRLLIKVCGLTTMEDLKFCQDQGVDLTGFIFHPSSPRYVSPQFVGSWEKKDELRVGVFVEQKPEDILKIMDMAGLDLAQLHGGQDRKTCVLMGAHRVIRTFWPERFELVEDFMAELDDYRQVCRYFLFDAGKGMGGHGRSIASPWLKQVTCSIPCLLAGGLGPDNIEEVLDSGAVGLDLNSGVEKSPGVKDMRKITRAINIIRRKI